MELYIGVPNGMILCVDGDENGRICGRLYHAYQQQPVCFESIQQAIRYAETFFDEMGFPFADTNSRSFLTHSMTYHMSAKKQRILSDSELMRQRGSIASFILRVQHRQYSSWQGSVTWMEKEKTRTFHSLLELLKLLEAAVDKSK